MSYYTRAGDHVYLPTSHAGGAWNPTEVHFAPLSALMLHEIDLHRAAAGDVPPNLGRVSFDILGFLGAGECTITVETIRPGRTIELVEAVAAIDGRAVARARAWFLGAFDTSSVAGGAPGPLPAPDAVEPRALTESWSGGFVESLDVRAVTPPEPGRAIAWLSSAHELIEGDTVSDHVAFLRLVDTANGIAVRARPQEWVFPNVDLTIHLHRQPTPGWVGLDTTVVFGSSGLGVTQTVLHDAEGAVGVAHQALTVRPAR
jgi:acyl-CoA thioesterase